MSEGLLCILLIRRQPYVPLLTQYHGELLLDDVLYHLLQCTLIRNVLVIRNLVELLIMFLVFLLQFLLEHQVLVRRKQLLLLLQHNQDLTRLQFLLTFAVHYSTSHHHQNIFLYFLDLYKINDS